MLNFSTKMAVKVTKGQICTGTIEKFDVMCHKEYYLFGKFHTCIKSAHKVPFLVLWKSAAMQVCVLNWSCNQLEILISPCLLHVRGGMIGCCCEWVLKGWR